MSNLKNNARQYLLVAMQDFDFQDSLNGSATSLELALPTNSIVVGGGVLVETPWNSATSAALAVGVNGGSGLVAAANLKAAGYTPFVVGAAFLANYNGGNARMTLTEVGAAATQGKGKLVVQYIIVDRVNEIQVN